MNQDKLRPTVAHAYENDRWGVIARVAPESLLELNLRAGDVGLIRGDREVPVKLWKQASEDRNSGRIYLDDFIRQNAGAAIGTTVTVDTVESAPAEKIKISPYRGMEVSGDLFRSDPITNQWFNRPVSTGDVVPVMVDHDERDCIPLIIDDTEPDGVVMIKRETIITS